MPLNLTLGTVYEYQERRGCGRLGPKKLVYPAGLRRWPGGNREYNPTRDPGEEYSFLEVDKDGDILGVINLFLCTPEEFTETEIEVNG